MVEVESVNASNSNWQVRFFAFFGAQAVSLIGSNIAQFAITWWLARCSILPLFWHTRRSWPCCPVSSLALWRVCWLIVGRAADHYGGGWCLLPSAQQP